MRAIAATHLVELLDGHDNGPLARLRALFSEDVPSSPEMSQANALRWLSARVSIKRADRVFVVDVSVSAPTADLAARLANAVADGYLADQAESRARAGEQAVTAMSAWLEAQRSKVAADANAVEAYKRTHNILTAGGQLVGDKNLADLNAQLTAARSRATTLQATIDQIDGMRASHDVSDATIEALQSGVIAKLREQESGLVAHQAELSSRLGPRHPAMRAVGAQLANVRRLIGAELTRIAKSTHADYQRAVADERLLTAQVAKAKTAAEATSQSSVGLRELERDLEADRTVYGAFLVRVQEIREQAGIDTTNARVITRALPPRNKSWPPLLTLLAGAIGSGFGLGSGLALLREYARPSIMSAGQIERVVGAPVIGVLPGRTGLRPKAAGTRTGRRFGVRSNRRKRSAPYPRLLAIAGLALRRLYHVGPHERETATVRSLVVATNGESLDVSREACELLAAAARLRGERVLLIDAHGDEASDATGAGLAEVLRGDKPLDAVVARSTSSTVATLGIGYALSAVTGDVSWNGARQLLADARSHFDLVIVNVGVLEENLAVVPLLCAADEMIFVAQLSHTAVADVTNSAENAAILGRAISAILLVDPAATA